MSQKLFHKDFTLIVLGQIVSLLGNALLSFALPLYLLDLTGSGATFGFALAVSVVPYVLFSPVGGVLADRLNRRNIMVALDFVTAALVLATGLFLSPANAMPCVCATLVCLAVIRAFYQPAVQSSVPAVTASGHLLRANSVVNTVTSLSALLGPLLGGVLYGLLGINRLVFLCSLCFLLSAIMELFILIPFEKQQATGGALAIIKSDFSDGLRFIARESPLVLRIMLLVAFFNLVFSSFLTVGLAYLIKVTYGLGSELYGIAEGFAGAGALLGSILVGVFVHRFRFQQQHIALCLIGLSILPIGFILLLDFPALAAYLVIVACSTISMMMGGIFSVVCITYVQQITPANMVGKVMALVMAVSMCAVPLGQAVYGILFDHIASYLHLMVLVIVSLVVVVTIRNRHAFISAPVQESQ